MTAAGITFANQEKLDKLPIPSVEDTCRQYLEVLKPLQTAREHAQTEEAVKKFLRTHAATLQERLVHYSANRSSYIEQFWYDSYLNFDNPVVLNLNPFFLLEDDSTPYPPSQVQRAATLTMSSLRFVRALRREELPPDNFRGEQLCMYQYSRLFGSARIPTSNGCVMQSYNSSKHIVVVCRSQFYWFDVLDENNDLILSEHDIALNFDAIMQDAYRTPITEACKGAVGVLTTENRRIWAGTRENSALNKANQECLRKIDWALFVVCLDHNAPQSLSDLAENMLCGTSELEKGVQVGTCTNRWYDKLQLIVTKNAKAGINFEHTGVDGHTVLRFASDIYTDTILRFAKSINGQAPSLWATNSPEQPDRHKAQLSGYCTEPRKLEWVKTPELAVALRFAETRLADLIQQNEFQALEFDHYGMDTIKQMGFSPDAFVQMAFQAAYYSLYGRVECSYEPAMTKRFLHGRTESIRVVSQESLRFVRKFCDDGLASSKLESLRVACQKHTETTKRCSQGLGQDRHLYALFCIWKRMVEERDTMLDSDSSDTASTASSARDDDIYSIPSIFADRGWDMLSNVILSTSNCGNPALKLFGFGPVSPDGFGIGYIIKPDSITICASSKHRQTQRFLDTLDAYFQEVRHLYDLTSADGSKLWVPSRVYSAPTPSISVKVRNEHFGRSLLPSTPPPPSAPKPPGRREGDSIFLLGGYGYFDVGEEVGDNLRGSRASSPEPLARKRVTQQEIGRKLRLAEY